MGLENARNFINGINKSSIYFGIGKIDAWNGSDTVENHLSYAPNAMIEDFNDTIFFKKITPGQFSMAARRYDWVAGEVFFQWDGDDVNLMDKMFYCVNEDGYVYICINNNNGVESTEIPTNITPARFTTSDGYVWKLVACIPETSSIQFNNSSFIPISTIKEPTPGFESQYASQKSAIKGTVDRLDVVQRGKRYSPHTKIHIIGDGIGAKVNPVIHSITGEIIGANVINNGTGYTRALVYIVDDYNISGSGAILKAILSPKDGHGSDPERELFCNYVIGSLVISNNESLILDHDFEFRKIGIYENMVNNKSNTIEVFPHPGLVISNQDESFIIDVLNNNNADDIILKINTSDGVYGPYLLMANDSDPYNGLEAAFSGDGLVVGYIGTSKTWRIEFSNSVSREIYSGFDIEIVSHKGVQILDEYSARYDFESNNTVSNIPIINNYSNLDANDPYYNNKITLQVTDSSGDFESGEIISFLNGGSAVCVTNDNTTIDVTSPIEIMTGVIYGMSSGASAVVNTYNKRILDIPGKCIYRHYFNKRTKTISENIKITPIFDFNN